MFKILFRVDSSSKIGSGHLMRCLNLAKYLNIDNTEFICTYNNKINIPFKVNYIEKSNDSWLGNTWEDDCDKTISIIKKNNLTSLLLIIDQYSIDYKWETKIRPFVKSIMVIDDLHNRKHNCDFLLDQNLYLDNINLYKKLVPENCKILLGCEYLILNKCFLNIKRVRTCVKRIYIFFGGSDTPNLTEKLLKYLIKYKNIVFDIVIGKLNKNYNNILNKYSNYKNINIYYNITQDKIATIIYNSDLCIGSSGTSCYERCVSGVFSLVITIANNQVNNAINLHKLGVIDYIGHYDKENLFNELIIKLEKYIKIDNWRDIYNKCLEFVDGMGLKRIKNTLKDIIFI